MRNFLKRRSGATKRQSVYLNEIAFQFYYNKMSSIAGSIFEWHNLPDTVDTVELEKTLLFNGQCLIFLDDVMGLQALPFNGSNSFDINGYPSTRMAYSSYTNYHKKCDRKNSVIIFDNIMRNNTLDDIDFFANKLWNYSRTMDINVNSQKTPTLILGSKDTKLSIKNAYQEFDGNMPVIMGNEKFNKDNFTHLSTGAPFIAPELNSLVQSVWNDFLTAVGVPNVNIQKKERLISDEVARGSGGSIACRYPRLNARERGSELLNNTFKDILDGDVYCTYRKELLDIGKGGGKNSEIHNVSTRDSEGNDA